METTSDPAVHLDEKALAWRAFLQSHSALLAVLEKELEAEAGMPLSQYEVLLYLYNSPDGGMRMNDLARSVLLSKSGVTRLIDRLVASGLVERAEYESDRRVTFARITPSGTEALRAAAPVHMRGVSEHFSRYLTDEEAQVLSGALLKIFRHAACDLGNSPDLKDFPATEGS